MTLEPDFMTSMMRRIMCIISILAMLTASICNAHAQVRLMPEDRRLFNEILSKDMSMPPFYDTGNRTKIEIAIVFAHMKVSEKADVQFSFYLYQNWFDPRLVLPCKPCKYNASSPPIVKAHTVDQKYWKNLWLSEMYIENSDTMRYHDSVMPNQFVWVLTNGSIWHGLRLDVKTTCKFGRMVFPVAKYVCNLKFRVHSYTKTEMTLDWYNKNEINYVDGFNEGGTKMTQYHKKLCDKDSTSIWNSACLERIIEVEKNLHQNFLRLYMPSVFIILTGWLSFWINRKESSARVKFGTLCVLAMITEDAGITFIMADSIRSSALDVWFAVCMVFATIVPVEYTIVHVVDRYQSAMSLMEEGKKGKKTCNHCTTKPAVDTHLLYTSTSMVAWSLKDVSSCDLHQMHCTKPEIKYRFIKNINSGEIEKVFRVLYPISFAIFMVIYWCFYLNYEEDFESE